MVGKDSESTFRLSPATGLFVSKTPMNYPFTINMNSRHCGREQTKRRSEAYRNVLLRRIISILELCMTSINSPADTTVGCLRMRWSALMYIRKTLFLFVFAPEGASKNSRSKEKHQEAFSRSRGWIRLRPFRGSVCVFDIVFLRLVLLILPMKHVIHSYCQIETPSKNSS